MSRLSLNCIVILAFFLTANFLLMPYLLSEIAPKAGLTISEMTWGLGICNAVAALTLYRRSFFPCATRILVLIMLLIIAGTVSVLTGINNRLPWMLLSGVGMMRISLVNFSDFNRQVHMQTNSEASMKRALSAANVVSNVVSCSIPLAAASILQKWGTAGLGKTAAILSLCSALLAYVLFSGNTSLKKVSVSGKPSPVNILNRFRRYLPLYFRVLINSMIFAFIFSYIPLKITQVSPDKLLAAQKYIALYFTVNSLTIVTLSFSVIYLTGKIAADNKKIIIYSSFLTLLSLFFFIAHEKELYKIITSSLVIALSEILFIPFIVSYVAASKTTEKR